ncbi:MAG: sulfotransferase [Lysobacterales bacterium]
MQEIITQIKQGNLHTAKMLCQARLAERPDDVLSRFYFAFILWRCSQPGEALEQCREILAHSPADAGLLSDLGNLCRELGANAEALDALDQSLELRPGNPGTTYNRALVLDALGRSHEALKLADAFAGKDPMFSRARFLAGKIRQDYGDMSAAESDFRDCIKADPGNARAWYALALTRRFAPGDAIIADLRRQLITAAGDPDSESHLHFALAKVLDDAGAYDDASEHLLEANSLVNTRYDGPGIEARLGRLREQFNSAIDQSQDEMTGTVPVFIVGLPRSGTTLLESLLARHPGILALGELDTLPHLVSDFRRSCNRDEFDEMGRQYLAALPLHARQYTLALDKMPSNFWRLGHIVAMLPNAKIIHCRREFRDVAISNFFNLYASGNSFAYSLRDLAHYTACHDAIMDHWNGLLGERILRVDYEELVRNPHPSMTATMNYLGFRWETGMLDAPDDERRIRTASLWQARQGIFTSSVARWRNYPRLADEFMSHYQEHSSRLNAR